MTEEAVRPFTPDEKAAVELLKNPAKIAHAYNAVFSHPEAPTVLAHIMEMCCVMESTADESVVAMATAEGRRQVWIAMNKILSMDARDIRDINRKVAAWGEED